MKNIVLDTNCLLACLSKNKEEYVVWKSLQEGVYNLCLTNEIIDEYTDNVFYTYQKIRDDTRIYDISFNLQCNRCYYLIDNRHQSLRSHKIIDRRSNHTFNICSYL